ncbi:hypothetical protein J2046_006282 [Rhizobium petrolearium]|uniref:hypothetical protein n=1 Tax=Neorhizobium petrolearium TaxID=515361 RepID=UPI001AEA110A|nr:hypothetical protein [Neorhizobium petrolearium]MBP1847997.1 hypothetical protein [Neorhizobium petrolearium]
MSLDYTIRLYELLPDGELESLGGGPISQYGGSCPNVGDTIARFHVLEESFKFYNVQRRFFINSADGDEGWAILIRAVEASALMSAVADEWLDETRFWRDVDEQERAQEAEDQRRKEQQKEERRQNAPRHGLHPREVKALRYMVEHPESVTIEAIRGAGEHTIGVLAEAGLVRRSGRAADGSQQWRVTKEGKSELQRWEAWRNL